MCVHWVTYKTSLLASQFHFKWGFYLLIFTVVSPSSLVHLYWPGTVCLLDFASMIDFHFPSYLSLRTKIDSERGNDVPKSPQLVSHGARSRVSRFWEASWEWGPCVHWGWKSKPENKYIAWREGEIESYQGWNWQCCLLLALWGIIAFTDATKLAILMQYLAANWRWIKVEHLETWQSLALTWRFLICTATSSIWKTTESLEWGWKVFEQLKEIN